MFRLVRRYGLWALAIIVLVVIGLTLRAQPVAQPAFLDKRGGCPLILAHKGGDGLAPGNTLAAFTRGLQEGADILETDARLTADGYVVLFHDETVDATTDGTGKVADLTLAELQKLDAGYDWSPDGGTSYPFRGKGLRIVTLEEALQAFPDARFNIDMKTHTQQMVKAVAEVVQRTGAQNRVLVTSFDATTARAFRSLMPGIPSSLADDEAKLFFGLQLLHLTMVYSPPAAAAQVPEYQGSLRVVTPHFVEAAHSRGMQVHVWTVNDQADMRRLLDMGVDGIVTDYPDVLANITGCK